MRIAFEIATPVGYNKPIRVLDPGAGDGAWGNAAYSVGAEYARNNLDITGIDIRDLPKPAAYTNWHTMDFRAFEPSEQYWFVIGNPPYKYAENFVRAGLDALDPNGAMIYLLRLAFLEGQKRAAGLWRDCRPDSVYVLGRRPSFTGNGRTDATAYALFLWRGASHMFMDRDATELHWLNW